MQRINGRFLFLANRWLRSSHSLPWALCTCPYWPLLWRWDNPLICKSFHFLLHPQAILESDSSLRNSYAQDNEIVEHNRWYGNKNIIAFVSFIKNYSGQKVNGTWWGWLRLLTGSMFFEKTSSCHIIMWQVNVFSKMSFTRFSQPCHCFLLCGVRR